MTRPPSIAPRERPIPTAKVQRRLAAAIAIAGGVNALAREWRCEPSEITRSKKSLRPRVAFRLGLSERTCCVEKETP